MYAARRQRLVETFAEHKIDLFFVTSPPNIRYLSGFTGSNAILLVDRERTILLTDPRYTIQAAAECDCPSQTLKRPLSDGTIKIVERWKPRRVGFEKSRISYAAHAAVAEKLPNTARLVPVDFAIEILRAVKDDAEVAAIRKSVAVNSRAFSEAMRRFRAGMLESELAAEIDYRQRRLGASGPAFETIVAAGERTALPHARPETVAIGTDRLLLVDMGATVDGYASDMTRTMAVGKVTDELKRMYAAVLEAQLAAIDAVRPGITAGEVDGVARRVLNDHGLGREFVHSTGHGLGLEIHESPRLGKKDKTKLAAGMTITIEPGVYRQGTGGIRIEDTVLVTAHGCEVLTPTPKDYLSI